MSRLACRTPDPVELLLRRILKRSTLIAASAAAACGGASESTAIGETTRSSSASSAGGLGPALSCREPTLLPIEAEALHPVETYDYLAIRRRSGLPNSPDGGVGTEDWSAGFQVLSETGEKCATAQSQACADKVARHPTEFVATDCVQTCSELSVVTTRGDEVKRWTGQPGLRTLLGEIDNADEALLIAAVAGYSLTCDDAQATSWREVPEGYELYATRATNTCNPVEVTRYHLRVSRAGELSVLGSKVLSQNYGGCIGRKPAGLFSSSRDGGRSKLGDMLAHNAHLEAASVFAFERLAAELSAFGAPESLVDAALAARADEVRHADLIGRLALLNGGAPVQASVAPQPGRELEEVALENAVEGCVRETYGALVGGYQAQHACNGALRVAMERIAQDEARHAALSHQVHRWIMPRLEPAARQRVRYAQQRAIFELAAEIAVEPDAELARLAGLPPAEVARALLAELSKTLWRPALRARAHRALGA